MKRGRDSSDTAGILVIDKPPGISSYDVIRAVKRRLSPRKIGHTGTLDPLASGVLPLVMNRATKAIPFLDEKTKCYEGTLRLGIVTDSDDSTGRIVSETPLHESRLAEDRIQTVCSRFLGKMKQPPPMYSAAKYQGKPLYEFARQGIRVEKAAREVEIFSLRIIRIALPFVDFAVSCSRGTYVRTLSRQVGDALDVGAHLCRLMRIRSGPFSLEQSMTLAEFDRLVDNGEIEKRMIPLRAALPAMPEIEIGRNLEGRIRDGCHVSTRDLEGLHVPLLEGNQRVMILHEGEIVAIAKAQEWGTNDPRHAQTVPALSLLRVFV